MATLKFSLAARLVDEDDPDTMHGADTLSGLALSVGGGWGCARSSGSICRRPICSRCLAMRPRRWGGSWAATPDDERPIRSDRFVAAASALCSSDVRLIRSGSVCGYFCQPVEFVGADTRI